MTDERKQAEEILAEWEAESSDRILDRIEYNERVIYPAMQEFAAQEVARATKEMSIAFADWLDTLEPSQRVSVWSKNGEWKGLFTMDNEQLYDKWKQNIQGK